MGLMYTIVPQAGFAGNAPFAAFRFLQPSRRGGLPTRWAGVWGNPVSSIFISVVDAAAPHNAGVNIVLFLGGLRPPNPSCWRVGSREGVGARRRRAPTPKPSRGRAMFTSDGHAAAPHNDKMNMGFSWEGAALPNPPRWRVVSWEGFTLPNPPPREVLAPRSGGGQ